VVKGSQKLRTGRLNREARAEGELDVEKSTVKVCHGPSEIGLEQNQQ
jgi:hypothetical protein